MGPLLCVDCEIFAREHELAEYYRCPRCDGDALEYLWMYTEEDQKRIKATDKFYRFVRGTDK